jgi:hypothetical protein
MPDTIRWEFRLIDGQSVYVDIDSLFYNIAHIAARLSKGEWYTDMRGWKINPANIVMFRKYEN